MKKIILVLLALCPLRLLAQGGSDALPFVRTDFGPTLTGTAGAAVASHRTGAWGVFRNASALVFDGSMMNLGGEFRILGGGNSGGAAALSATMFDNLGIGAGFAYLGGDRVGDFKTSDMVLSGGLGYSVTENIGLGINIRYAQQNLAESVQYHGYNVDISALAKVSDELSVALGVSTLGKRIVSASGSEYRQPANVYAGAEYSLSLPEGYSLSLDAMAEYYFSGNYGAAIGGSFTYDDNLTLRAGYRFASEWCVLPSEFSVGLGGRLGAFTLDAGYTATKSLSLICLSAGFCF